MKMRCCAAVVFHRLKADFAFCMSAPVADFPAKNAGVSGCCWRYCCVECCSSTRRIVHPRYKAPICTLAKYSVPRPASAWKNLV
jgi:hypothetical protein